MRRVEELQAKLARVHEVADACVASSDDPKDKAEHERWRKLRAGELEAKIAAAQREAERR